MKIFTKKQKYTLWGFVGLAVLVLALAYISTPAGALEVHFLDVGQGDAIFIKTPSGRQVLIDGGRVEAPVLQKLGAQMPFYDRSIDIVAATHMDADHIGGLISVLENFSVGTVFVSTNISNSPLSDRFWQIVEDKNIPAVQVERGDELKIDKEIYMYALHPPAEFLKTADDNEASLVFKLVYKNDSFLFTGDIEKRAEYALAQGGSDISADVLKVSHHGSNTSSVQYFLDKVKPKLAVIQVGENSYGHPHPAVLSRLENMQILRNDVNGTVSIYSYGDSI